MLARDIFQLDNVEAASHTYSHPFKWRKADLAITLAEDFYEMKEIPVNYLHQTEGSLRFIEMNLLPSHKKADILLWSGGCHPDERPLKILAQYNRLNMNGGDPIYDEEMFRARVAQQIYIAMKEQKLSSADLAKKVGVKPNTVRCWLGGLRTMPAPQMIKVGTALGFSWEFNLREKR